VAKSSYIMSSSSGPNRSRPPSTVKTTTVSSSSTVRVWVAPGGSWAKEPAVATQSYSRYRQRPETVKASTHPRCRCRGRVTPAPNRIIRV
jgi:hypothetical protein